MSLLKANAVQLGQSLTASQNFTWYQPATPDGTVRLGNGNSGSVTDLVTLNASGQMFNGLTAVPSGFTSAYGKYWAKQSTTNLYGYVSAASAADAVTYFGHNGTVGGIGTTYGSSGAYTPLAFYTSDVERMRLDISGNLGLGVTPSAWGSGIKAFQLANGPAFASVTSNTYIGNNWYNDGTNNRYISNSYATLYGQNTAGQHVWYIAPSGTAGNAISFTQAMTLDASGNLLIGATSGPAGGARLRVVNNVTNIWDFGPNTGSSFVVYNPSQVGVYISNGNTSWTSTSDERLKENLIPIENAVSKVSTLRAVTGNFIADEEKRSRPFLIAQDVQAVLPEAVDATDPDKLGVQYTDTIPLLVAAIKELSAELNELKQKVNA